MFNPFENPAFMLYAMEQEGELDTHESKINKAIKYLSRSYNPEDLLEQYSAFERAGLAPGDLSSADIDRIVREAKCH